MNNQHCLHQLFEEQVELTPDAIAVIQEQQQISYESLNQKANQLAHYLQRQGIKPEKLVGMCVERSVEMVIALLGILKAGGAYVPLDPQYPQDRLEYMIRDTQMSVIVTQSHLVKQLPENLSANLTIICIDRDWQHISQEASENPKTEVKASNLAYVIYTSGSTGQPKGVMIEHRSVVKFTESQKVLWEINGRDRILQFVSISFDALVIEIYCCLSAGATSVLRTEEMLSSFSIFIKKCQEWQLTVLTLPTAFWHSLITELARNSEKFPESVRLVLVGGERLLPEKLNLWQDYIQKLIEKGQLSKSPQLFNCYGPTETTVIATLSELSAYTLGENSTSAPIGNPISHTQVYLLDKDLQPVPKGTPGELYIGGISLARGYLNNQELTEEKFINNPLNPTERLYKTEDWVRYLEDGNLEYVSRIDNQIKIRGFRVELGEIESVLAQHSAIDSAAVICSEEQLGDKRLMAYVVPHLVSGDAVEPEKAQEEYISLWKTVYQQTDSETPILTDITFNIVGWNSSYDGQPIPEREMSEWVEQTVARIKDLHPQYVLEIGCGTGLLLTRVAPDCKEYVGIDFSRSSLEHIRKIQQVMGGLEHIKLLEREADNLDGLESQSFDTVIINSVLQYFPNPAYLLRVLEAVIKRVKPGGHILIGDIRNLALLETYCLSVEVYRANDHVTASQLKERIIRQEKAEEELLLDPLFWLALQQKFPEISHVQILPKQGVYHNELTRFRYEAILYINDGSLKPLKEINWLDWQSDQLNLVELQRILKENQPACLGVRSIPNARLDGEVYAKEWLERTDKNNSVKQLKQWLFQQPERGIEIQTICELAQGLSYWVEISWINTDATGKYDVVLSQNSLPFQPAIFPIHSAIQELLVYANNPLQTKFNQQLISQLRQFLKQKLPDYMIPTGIGILEKLPLTPNGKIDRQALARLSSEGYLLSENQANFVAPRTPEEERLANLWAEVLQVEQIGIHDNFFEFGGNSLKVIVLLNRIQEEFNKNVPMVDLFKSPTIAELVTGLQKESSIFNPIEKITANSPDEIRYLPPSFLQERFWTYRHLGSFYHIPNYFHLEGHLNVTILEKSCNEIIRRHEILRTQLQEINGSLVQVVVPNATINFSVIDLQNLSKTEQNQKIERLTQQKIQSFVSLDKDPWLSVTLVKLAETSHILLICLHNLIADERSTEIFLQELSVLYNAFLADQPSPLPELPLQYGDYAIAQHQSLTEEVLQARRNYWQHWLSREPQPLVLPTDKPVPEVQSFQAEILQTQISPELTAKLKILAQKQQVTLFTTVAAVLGLLLYRYNPGESLVIGVPVSERSQRQFNSLIGDFGKIWFLRLDLGENPQFLPLLERVRQEMLSVIAYQDVPFQQIAKTFQPPIERSQRFFRVYLDFLLGTPRDYLELSGLSITSIPIQSSMARVDLGLIVWQKDTSLGTSLQLEWRYKKDLFEANTIAQMSVSFQNLLEEVMNEQ